MALLRNNLELVRYFVDNSDELSVTPAAIAARMVKNGTLDAKVSNQIYSKTSLAQSDKQKANELQLQRSIQRMREIARDLEANSTQRVPVGSTSK